MLIMLLTLISTYMQNIIWILSVHNLFLAVNGVQIYSPLRCEIAPEGNFLKRYEYVFTPKNLKCQKFVVFQTRNNYKFNIHQK